MPLGLKNAPSEFQNIMNDIFTLFTDFPIVYIDDVLIFSKSIDDHWKHLDIFVKVIKHNGLVVSATKILDNEKNDRHIRNTICHKCKEYGHTKNNVIDIIKLLNKSIN